MDVPIPIFAFEIVDAKRVLNEWFTKVKVKAEIEVLENSHDNSGFSATYSFNVESLGVDICETHIARSKKLAQTYAAVKVLNKLHEYNIHFLQKNSTLYEGENASFKVDVERSMKESLLRHQPIAQQITREARQLEESPILVQREELLMRSVSKRSNSSQDIEKIDVANRLHERDRQKLPIYNYRQTIIETIENNQITLIRASTGSGKTTQIPQYILDNEIQAGRGRSCRILVTQPRKLAAISIAARVAFERGEVLKCNHSSVGYMVRFDKCFSRTHGSITFCTTGYMLKLLTTEFSHLIIDEIHEYDANRDILLAMARRLIRDNSKIRIVLMSATISLERFMEYFSNEPKIIDIHSVFHPVTTFNLDWIWENLCLPTEEMSQTSLMRSIMSGSNKSLEKCIETIIEHILQTYSQSRGSILIFLHGWDQIRAVHQWLQQCNFYDPFEFEIFTLHSKLPKSISHRVFETNDSTQRKIILSTNIAESSVTIENVEFVIDTAISKTRKFDGVTNSISYPVIYVSKSNIKQRAGRAGRTRPGYTFLLITQEQYEHLSEFQQSELNSDLLTSVITELTHFQVEDIRQFLKETMNPPEDSHVDKALQDLSKLNILKNDQLTSIGELIERIPVSPEIGRMMLVGLVLGIGDIAVTMAASMFMTVFSVDHSALKLEDLLLSIDQNDPQFGLDHFSDSLVTFKVVQHWILQKPLVLSDGQVIKLEHMNQTTLAHITKIRHQFVGIFKEFGFEGDNFELKERYSKQTMNLARSIMLEANFRNLAAHSHDRSFFTGINGETGKISSATIIRAHQLICSNMTSSIPALYHFEQKTFITEKIFSLKIFSKIATPVQCLLFGKSNIEVLENGSLEVNGFLKVSIDKEVQDAIFDLKDSFEVILVKICENPFHLKKLQSTESNESKIIEKIIGIGSEEGFQIQKTSLATKSFTLENQINGWVKPETKYSTNLAWESSETMSL